MASRISDTEMRVFLDEQIAKLDNLTRPTWKRYKTSLEQLAVRRGEEESEQLFVVARAGREIVYFDDRKDEFGAGELEESGVLRDYGTYGSELRQTLRHFPKLDRVPGNKTGA